MSLQWDETKLFHLMEGDGWQQTSYRRRERAQGLPPDVGDRLGDRNQKVKDQRIIESQNGLGYK